MIIHIHLFINAGDKNTKEVMSACCGPRVWDESLCVLLFRKIWFVPHNSFAFQNMNVRIWNFSFFNQKRILQWQYIYALSIYVFVTLHVWMVMMMKGLGYSIILPDSCVSHSSYSLIVDWWLRTKTKTTKGKKNILGELRKKKSRWIKNENKKYWLRCEVWGGPITQYCYWQTGN